MLTNCKDCRFFGEEGCGVNPNHWEVWRLVNVQKLVSVSVKSAIENNSLECNQFLESEELKLLTAKISIPLRLWKLIAKQEKDLKDLKWLPLVREAKRVVEDIEMIKTGQEGTEGEISEERERRIEIKIFGSDGEIIFNTPYLVGELCTKDKLEADQVFIYPWGHDFDTACVYSPKNGGDYVVASGWRVVFGEGDKDYLSNLPLPLTVKDIDEASELVFPLTPLNSVEIEVS